MNEWTLGRATKAFALVPTLMAILILVFQATDNSSTVADVLTILPFVLVTAAGMWLFAFRPRAWLSGGSLEVINPLRKRTVDLKEIRTLEPKSNGLSVGLADGRRVVVWVLQKDNISLWLAKERQGDRAAVQIASKARQLGSAVTVTLHAKGVAE